MTVIKLIATAVLTGSSRARIKKGTRKIPPLIPNNEPRQPATAPVTAMMRILKSNKTLP